jgi:hypothetical protein
VGGERNGGGIWETRRRSRARPDLASATRSATAERARINLFTNAILALTLIPAG